MNQLQIISGGLDFNRKHNTLRVLRVHARRIDGALALGTRRGRRLTPAQRHRVLIAG